MGAAACRDVRWSGWVSPAGVPAALCVLRATTEVLLALDGFLLLTGGLPGPG